MTERVGSEMHLKKFALRGMIALAVIIALCVLFSGTIRTLITPKVRYAPVKMGKFENTVNLTGTVVFPEEEQISVAVPEGLSVTVSRVYVSPGQKVKKGEKLLAASVTGGDKSLVSLQQEVDSARDALDAWERKNGNIRLNRNETLWMEAYYAARDAEKAEREARFSLMAYLEPSEMGNLPEMLPEGAGEEMTAAWTEWQEAREQMTAARQKLQELDRYAIAEDVWTLLQDKREKEQKQADAEEQMMQILLLSRQVATITAPHKGYIAAVSVEKGSVLSEDSILITMMPEGQTPVIRMDISNVKQKVQKGTTVSIDSDSWGRTDTKVVNTGMSESGHPYADAEITDEVIYTLGQVSDMMKEEIKLRMSSRAQESTCLLPAAAVRGSGEGRYVYVGEQETSALAGTRITVQQVKVTVLAESSSTVSVAEDLSRSKVLYMEDRTLTEGGTVMLYEE